MEGINRLSTSDKLNGPTWPGKLGYEHFSIRKCNFRINLKGYYSLSSSGLIPGEIMKNLKLIALLFALATYYNGLGQEDTFVLDTLNFQASFESEPNITFDTAYNEYLNTNIFTQNFNLDIADTTKPNFRYRITRMVYPSSFVHSDSSYSYIESIFYAFQAELEKDSTMYFKNTTVIDKNGYPGKEFKWRNTNSGSLFKFQYFPG